MMKSTLLVSRSKLQAAVQKSALAKMPKGAQNRIDSLL
jgi:hypothetical protein